MFEAATFIVIGVVLLYVGGEGLVRGSSALALRMGMTPLLAGLTIVAFGTSAPELVVSAKAAFMGRGDIAAGNVVGSNIFNIAFILGLTCVIHPLRVQLQILKFDAPVMVVAALALVACLADGRVSRMEGALLFAGILVYIVAAVKKQPDIALGNIVGSNIFNVFAIMGIAALVNPVTAAGIGALDLWTMVGASVFLVPFLWTGLVLQRWEGGLLLASYGVYLFLLWPK